MNKIKAILLIFVLCTGCQSSHHQYISRQLHIPIKDYKEITYQDSRGWFNDGEIYSVTSFSNNKIEKDIQKSSHFHTLPLSLKMKTFLKDYTNHNELLHIKKGYYFFYDRHNRIDKETLNCSHYNVILAIYDTQTHKLYYLELNT